MQGRLKLTKLILAGENKKDAIINFKGGLNVIAGASDTGKSFAFECIDFALGSSAIVVQLSRQKSKLFIMN